MQCSYDGTDRSFDSKPSGVNIAQDLTFDGPKGLLGLSQVDAPGVDEFKPGLDLFNPAPDLGVV